MLGPNTGEKLNSGDARFKAISIPTQQYEKQGQKVLPSEHLMQLYLNHASTIKAGGDINRLEWHKHLIEVDVQEWSGEEEAPTSPIKLNAKFEHDTDKQYMYDLEDKSTLNKKPPAAIQITKLPKKGSMKTKANGKEKVVEIGDIVEAENMEDFVYDQEDAESCTTENDENCNDTFSFIPLSSWEGKGDVSETMISLNPVQIEERPANTTDPVEDKEINTAPVEEKKMAAPPAEEIEL